MREFIRAININKKQAMLMTWDNLYKVEAVTISSLMNIIYEFNKNRKNSDGVAKPYELPIGGMTTYTGAFCKEDALFEFGNTVRQSLRFADERDKESQKKLKLNIVKLAYLYGFIEKVEDIKFYIKKQGLCFCGKVWLYFDGDIPVYTDKEEDFQNNVRLFDIDKALDRKLVLNDCEYNLRDILEKNIDLKGIKNDIVYIGFSRGSNIICLGYKNKKNINYVIQELNVHSIVEYSMALAVNKEIELDNRLVKALKDGSFDTTDAFIIDDRKTEIISRIEFKDKLFQIRHMADMKDIFKGTIA